MGEKQDENTAGLLLGQTLKKKAASGRLSSRPIYAHASQVTWLLSFICGCQGLAFMLPSWTQSSGITNTMREMYKYLISGQIKCCTHFHWCRWNPDCSPLSLDMLRFSRSHFKYHIYGCFVRCELHIICNLQNNQVQLDLSLHNSSSVRALQERKLATCLHTVSRHPSHLLSDTINWSSYLLVP